MSKRRYDFSVGNGGACLEQPMIPPYVGAQSVGLVARYSLSQLGKFDKTRVLWDNKSAASPFGQPEEAIIE